MTTRNSVDIPPLDAYPQQNVIYLGLPFMSLITSDNFASAAASGADWREASKAVLELLENAKAKDGNYNFGFLYISDSIVDDASGILNIFKSVLGIEHWVGTVGIGVCTQGRSFIDVPAISAMVGYIPPEDFHVFTDPYGMDDVFETWRTKTNPMLYFVHGDPIAAHDPAVVLKELAAQSGGFLIGGLSSSRTAHIQFAGDMAENDISGMAFSPRVKLLTTLSQGCVPIGGLHTITRGDGHIIREIDEQKASEVFEEDLRQMAIKKIGRDPDKIMIDDTFLDEDNPVPEEFKSVLTGEIHIALPVSESDQKDYLVRNIIGVDPDEGAIAISENIGHGERILFVHRDHNSVVKDLRLQLEELRQRVIKDTGEFAPKAALYVSCVARGYSQNAGTPNDEMALVQEVLGDVPLAGFYAGGEISNARLYGYTGILTLFL